MHVFGLGGGEMFALLFVLIFQIAIVAVIALVLYFIIRKAVCAGMEDFEKKKSEHSGGRPVA